LLKSKATVQVGAVALFFLVAHDSNNLADAPASRATPLT